MKTADHQVISTRVGSMVGLRGLGDDDPSELIRVGRIIAGVIS